MARLVPDDIDLICVHCPCTDGYMAYVIAERYCKIHGKTLLQYVADPRTPCPLTPAIVRDKNVLVCDVAWDKATNERIRATAKGVLFLDHHATNEAELSTLPSECKIFDTRKSGASLAWDFFFPDEPMPLIVRYVQDFDTGAFRLPHSKTFMTAIFQWPFTLEAYVPYLDVGITDPQWTTLLQQGIQISRERSDRAALAISQATHGTITYEEKEYKIIYVSGRADMISPLADSALSEFPHVSLVAVHHYDAAANETVFSLRSRPQGFHVGNYAKSTGRGGGHPGAARIVLTGQHTQLP